MDYTERNAEQRTTGITGARLLWFRGGQQDRASVTPKLHSKFMKLFARLIHASSSKMITGYISYICIYVYKKLYNQWTRLILRYLPTGFNVLFPSSSFIRVNRFHVDNTQFFREISSTILTPSIWRMRRLNLNSMEKSVYAM